MSQDPYLSRKDVSKSYRPRSYVSIPSFFPFTATFIDDDAGHVPRSPTRPRALSVPKRPHRSRPRWVRHRRMGVFDPCRQAGRFFRRGRGGEGDDEGEDDGGCVFVGRSRWRCIVPVLVVGCGHGGPGRERVSTGIGFDWRTSTLPFPRCARAHAGSRFPPSIGPDAENARVGCTPGRRPRAGVSTRFERGTAMTYAVLESILILYCFTMGGMHVHLMDIN
jgi:hypothetical protein